MLGGLGLLGHVNAGDPAVGELEAVDPGEEADIDPAGAKDLVDRGVAGVGVPGQAGVRVDGHEQDGRVLGEVDRFEGGDFHRYL